MVNKPVLAAAGHHYCLQVYGSSQPAVSAQRSSQAN